MLVNYFMFTTVEEINVCLYSDDRSSWTFIYPHLNQKNITCSIEGVEGRQLNLLVILFSNINLITSFITEGRVIQGIDVSFVNQSRARALISTNTDNTSTIGLGCGSLAASGIVEETTLNLTVYGELLSSFTGIYILDIVPV